MPVHDEHLLDNPIWNSLRTGHAHLATGGTLARRYPFGIGPLSGLRETSTEAWAELVALIPEGDAAVLFLEQPPYLPRTMRMVLQDAIVQMICRGEPMRPACDHPVLPLGPPDFAEMIALATLAAPGPFRAETATLGGFYGIRVDGRLAAMAGERLQPEGFSEVSAVCTHPDFRGRGYAAVLVADVAQQIRARGRTPFLTVLATNTGAISVYERVGFEPRRQLVVAVVRPAPTPGAEDVPVELPHR
jgi:ribosomal protein S18 acetylase RimI-like enzyme